MATYNVKVTVVYEYEVEADTPEAAELQGWEYEDYAHAATVYSIEVEEQENYEEDEDE